MSRIDTPRNRVWTVDKLSVDIAVTPDAHGVNYLFKNNAFFKMWRKTYARSSSRIRYG